MLQNKLLGLDILNHAVISNYKIIHAYINNSVLGSKSARTTYKLYLCMSAVTIEKLQSIIFMHTHRCNNNRILRQWIVNKSIAMLLLRQAGIVIIYMWREWCQTVYLSNVPYFNKFNL